MYATLKALREGTPPGKLDGVAPPALMKRVLREARYEAWTRDFPRRLAPAARRAAEHAERGAVRMGQRHWPRRLGQRPA